MLKRSDGYVYKCVGCSFITENIDNLDFSYCSKCEKSEKNKSYFCPNCHFPLLRSKK